MQKKILFFGTPEFAVPALTALIEHPAYSVTAVVTQPDRPGGRGNKLQPPPIKTLALTHAIPVLQPENIKRSHDSFIAELHSYAPFTIGVVVSFGQILPASVLTVPEHGCLNIHGSILPRWRGAAPMQRAILAGDSETGVCIMQMDSGLDTGAVYSKQTTAITESTTLGSLHDTLANIGAELLLESIPGILSGSLSPVPQPETGITYAQKILPEETKIDWSLPAHTVMRFIHGLSPFPGAYTSIHGRRIKFFTGRTINQNYSDTPGQIVCCDKNRLEIQCGSGCVQILEAQVEGKKRMEIAVFLRGVDFSTNDLFS